MDSSNRPSSTISPVLVMLVAAAISGCVGSVGGVGNVGSPEGARSGSGATAGNGMGVGTGGVGAGSAPGTGSGGTAGPRGNGGSGTGPVVLPPRDAGRVTMRKLNNVEYNNTVRDLLGTAQQPASTFLNDAPEFGFDNNADMLQVSPTQAGLYEQAAEALATEALSPAKRALLVTCDLAAGETCLRAIITSFGAKAYRRPLTEGEVAGFLKLIGSARTAGATADEALRTAVQGFLLSPHFLHRVELDPDPSSLVAHPVTPYETASRLSYLVYRSMPDAPLFTAAAAGKLSTTEDLQAQLSRMLADPKGSGFAADFSTQWLGARSLEKIQFDAKLFPKFNPSLAASMKAEISAFFDDFVKRNLPVDQLLTADFTFLDDALAQHYGVPAVGSTVLKKTTLTSPQRGGLMTMAGTLAVTSYATRTSLVKRGAWVLGQLLCAEPPAPPPDIPGFPEGVTTGTQREILVNHRTNPSCAVCHVVMDNLGLALENYDAIGAWRTNDKSGAVIDARGELPNGGATFNGGREMAKVVAADPRFRSCVVRNLLSYALGRTLLPGDEGYLADIAAPSATSGPGLRDILNRVVASDSFRMRHGEPASAGGGAKP